MTRILMAIAPDQFRDEELNAPRALFQELGWTVDVASTRAGEAKGMLGATENVSLLLDAILPSQYDAVLVVGGMGAPQYLWDNFTLHTILKTVYSNGKVVGAICLSGAVLAKAGLLNGRNATVYETPESLDALKQGGAYYTAEPVTEDRRIVTANGPEAATAFGQAVIRQIKSLVPASA